ncbi:MAG: glycosyltransferase [bacterium]|nr:glycosyltransferase [bacterium]
MTSTLSLIVCTYRRARRLERLLESVGRQSVRPTETLIIDGSDDGETERVVEAFASRDEVPGLGYFRVPPAERGLTRQRNFGIVRARGEIIAFLDDDIVAEPTYFEHVLTSFAAHPEALGVGGYLIDEVTWRRLEGPEGAGLAVFRWGEWQRREDYRWRLRRLLGLGSPLPPGQMPASGHGRPVSFLPPDGRNYRVEFIMGGASAWRGAVFERVRFSPYFEGYGLYEDLDFSIRVAARGPLYLCTAAHVHHFHAPEGRPRAFVYGRMVVRNGWLVWRRRWPRPPWVDRCRWWAITLLLALCRLGDAVRGLEPRTALAEAAGRGWGMLTVLWKQPQDPDVG